MCGMCGIYSKTFTAQKYDIFSRLLFLNVFRGEDSTGIVRVNKDWKVHTRKSILASPEFLKSGASDIIDDRFHPTKSSKSPAITLLGHTRAATKGSVTLRNAHPFGFPGVVGMHNGTIHKDFKHRKSHDTDSEALYRNIEEDGIEAALNEVNAFDTAYALQYVHKKKGELNFVRNDKRPLWFTYIHAGGTLVWSSSKDTLEYALNICNIKSFVGWGGNKEEPFFTLNENDLLTVKIGEEPDKASVTTLDVKKRVYTSSPNFTGDSERWGSWEYRNGTYKFIPRKTEKTESKTTTSNIVHIPEKKKSTVYSDAKATYGDKGLKNLSWLVPGKIDKDTRKEDGKAFGDGLPFDDPLPPPDYSKETPEGKYIVGYQGVCYHEKEMRHKFSEGCFACGQTFDIDDEDDLVEAEKAHWWSRDCWACDECYNFSDNNWVKHTVDNDWENAAVH